MNALLDSIALYSKRRFVAESYLSNLKIQVSEADARNFYANNLDLYSTLAQCSYLQAFIFKEDETTIERVKKMMSDIATGADPGRLH